MTQETVPDASPIFTAGQPASLWAEPKPAEQPGLQIEWLPIAAWTLSALWIALCLSYVANTVGFADLLQSPPAAMGGFLAGVIALPALLWMIVGHWQRLATFKRATAALQAQLAVLTAPHGDKRFDTVLGALQRQAALFTEASQTAVANLRTARGALRQESGLLQKSVTESATSLTEEAGRIRDISRNANIQFGQLDEMLGRSAERFQETEERFAAGTASLQGAVGQSLQQLR